MSWGVRSDGTRAIIDVNSSDKVAINQDGSMELLTPAANPSGNKIPTAGQLPFTKHYESTEQSVGNAMQVTLAHGFGSVPKLVQLLLVCKTAEAGYFVGDLVALYDCASGNSNDGTSVIYGAFNVIVRFGAVTGPVVTHASTGAAVRLTPANWRLIVRAWA